jgi:pilus assembly protein CpaB
MKAARLVVLGIAVAAGGLAAILAGGYQPAPAPPPPPPPPIPTIDILVAKNDIATGAALTESDIQWQTWPASAANPAFIHRNEHPDAIHQYAGALVRIPIAAGEPIRDNKIIRADGSGYLAAILPSGLRAASVEVSPENAAGGFILPNDRVDVILSHRDRDAEKATGIQTTVGETVLSDVRVLAIDQLVQEKDGQRVVIGKTATLEVSQAQAELLAGARQAGVVSLSLRSLADAKPSSSAITQMHERIGVRINMIRFGVTTPVTAK